MAYNPLNPNGQATMANSQPVVIASNQTPVSVAGTVSAQLQSTNASVITVGSPVANQSVSGTVGASVIGHAPVVIVGGSILTSATANQSVSGTVNVGNLPTNQNVSGSVVAFQGTNPWIITGSVQGNFGGGNSSVQVLNFPTNQSVSGTVAATQGTTPWVISSVYGNISGSVAAFQGGSPWAVTNVGSIISLNIGSIINVTQGSVAAIRAGQIGTVITSISGIPQASVHGSVSIVPASVITGHGSIVGAGSVQLFSATSNLRNYVTAFLVSNTGASTTLVTFTDGDASVIGKTIAPAGGGSNAPALATPMIPSVNKVVNAVAATATSVLHVWVGGYRAP